MSIDKLIEKARSFDMSENNIQKNVKDRELFTQKFPLEKLRELSLYDYCIGTDDNSFCYWLEFKNLGFGIGGGNSAKFGIYRTKNDKDEIVYASGFGKSKKYYDLESAQSEYSKLLDLIVQSLELTRLNKIDQISALNVPIGTMVLQKILSNYYPEKFLTIGSADVLIKCAKDLGIEEIKFNSRNLIQINSRIISALKRVPEFSDWHFEKLGNFIWDEYGFVEKQVPIRKDNEKQYWLYSPGEKAFAWDEFYQNGIMGIGWDEVGDLHQYDTREEIRDALKLDRPDSSDHKNNSSALDDFKNKMQIGDVIFAKKGRRNIIGMGIVESEYAFDNQREKYKHIRKVKWEKKGVWNANHNLVIKTLTDITGEKTELPQFKMFHERLMSIVNETESLIQGKVYDIKYPLNTIFYGPPGTGKTYNTVLRAAEIIEGQKIDKYQDALAIFNGKLHDQIEFITFHQNYSYEDFIQGLRPDTENDNQLTFDRVDGVFKVIADRALKNLRDSNNSSNLKRPFEEVFDEFIEPLIEGDVNEIEIDMKRVSYFITEVGERSIDFRKASGGTAHTLSITTLKKMYDAGSVRNKGLAIYYKPLMEILLKSGADQSANKPKATRNNYVIIIDEINRANISRVFGEFITLIEPDKRSEGELAMEVRLPSGDKFQVPSNLYIIGTMNTADKSIALLDIALRRRFEFEAMYPKYEIEGVKINHDDVLKKINEAIIAEKGHDFQIGHSYFMDSSSDPYDFERRMNVKVLPLLLEYFMNDANTVIQIVSKAIEGMNFKIDKEHWPLRVIAKND